MIRNKYLIEEEEKGWTETDSQSPFAMLKQDHELYKDEDADPQPIVRVSQVKLPQDGCNWEVYHDDKMVHRILGLKLTKKERSFLSSVAGMQFLLRECKQELPTIASLKKKLKALTS